MFALVSPEPPSFILCVENRSSAFYVLKASRISCADTHPTQPSGLCFKLTSSRQLSRLGPPGHRLTQHFYFAFQTLSER